MTDFSKLIREEARLVILRALADQVDETLSSSMLETTLRTYGIRKERSWVHDELAWLAEAGAVSITPTPGTVLVAVLTTKGRRHIDREIAIEGVKRPSRPEV
ncbi:VpaChn25_0724 family phage protein [Kaistia sp. MMO-174]|uniref:VpaChn25_0724 family phage protein n=1 Tax=Kaistia sp. MMO-174 TaxID=3081256 RepID=UPI00301B2AC4